MGFAIGGAILAGGALSYMGSQSAASAQENAANNATGAQLQMFNTQQANEAPYLKGGTQAFGELTAQLPQLEQNFNPSDFQGNPGYQFQLEQGQRALQQSAAARGVLNSTGTAQDMQNYSQGLAQTDYNNAYNQFNANRQMNYNMLSGVAGMGQAAVTGSNTAAQVAGNQIGANDAAIGNAQAAASVGGANAISGALGQGVNAYQNQQMVNSLGQMGQYGQMGNGVAPANSYGGGDTLDSSLAYA